MKYRKKPVVVTIWFLDNIDNGITTRGIDSVRVDYTDPKHPFFKIKQWWLATLEIMLLRACGVNSIYASPIYLRKYMN